MADKFRVGDVVRIPDGDKGRIIKVLPGDSYEIDVDNRLNYALTRIVVCHETQLKLVRQAKPVYTRFADIPPFIGSGRYHVDVPINRLPAHLGDLIAHEGLDLNPDFQRGHVWTEEQQIAYVEFLLRGGVSGRDIYLNYPFWLKGPPTPGAYADFVIVDGLQRVTAITRFVNNEIPAFGTLFKDYQDNIRVLTMNTVHVHVNDLPSKADVLRWYLQMNDGGTPHSDAELGRVRELLSLVEGNQGG